MGNITTPLRARPTIYKGIEMRSRLEAKYAQWLDESAMQWEYEPRCFADGRTQYLPDFRISDATGCIYIDVKGGYASSADIKALALERMPAIWSAEPDAALGIARDDPYEDRTYPFGCFLLGTLVDGAPMWFAGRLGRIFREIQEMREGFGEDPSELSLRAIARFAQREGLVVPWQRVGQ